MNSTAHKHNIEFTRVYPVYNTGAYQIKYGDTVVTIKGSHVIAPSKRRVNKAIKKAIKKHDVGSNIAATQNVKENQIKEHLSNINNNMTDAKWGSEQMEHIK